MKRLCDFRLVLGDGVRAASAYTWAGLLKAPEPVDALKAFETARAYFGSHPCADCTHMRLPADGVPKKCKAGELDVRAVMTEGAGEPAPGRFSAWMAVLGSSERIPMGTAAAEIWDRMTQMNRYRTDARLGEWKRAGLPEDRQVAEMLRGAGDENRWQESGMTFSFLPAAILCDPNDGRWFHA